MWSRRRFCRLAAGGLAGGAAPLLGAQVLPAANGPQGPRRTPLGSVVVAVDHRASFCHLPLTIAERLGYFADEGLDVHLKETGAVSNALQALGSGVAQVIGMPYSQILRLQMQGQMLRSLVLQGRTPQLVLGVSRRNVGEFRHLRDLQGRRVAVTGLGDASHRLCRLLFDRAGLGTQAVQFEVFDGTSATAAALHAGRIDAVCYHDPLITQLEQGGDLRVVVDTRTLRGSQDVFGGPFPASCLAVSEAFVREQPRVCQALAHGMVHALKWLQTAGPSDLNKTVPEQYFQGDRGLYMAAFVRTRESWVPDGLMPDRGPATAARTLAHFDDSTLVQRINLARTFTNEFALAAKNRFRA